MAASHARRAQDSSSGGGCGVAVAVAVLLGLAIRFWYVSVALVIALGFMIVLGRAKQRRRLRHRAGPWDAWLNEVSVAAADLGFREYARNRGTGVGGVAVLGDIVLRNRRQEIAVSLLADARGAHEAEMGLRVSPTVRDALARGSTALVTRDRALFLASGRSSVVDEFLLDEVVRVVDRIAIGSPRGGLAASGARTVPTSTGSSQDALEQLRKLGALREAGILSDAEFTEKKTSLLKQV